jgi:hypothetical protein
LQSFAVLSAEAITTDENDLGAVKETVEASRGQERIAEKVRPLGRGAVRSEQDAAALVPFVNNIIQVLGRGRLERLEAKVVEDEQVGTEIGVEPSLPGTVGPATVEVLEHLVDTDE